jgi:hypothetical protein
MMNRRLIAVTPLLLLGGILAQLILLVLALLLYVPCLIWPGLLNGPYNWITRGMARIMARSIIGHGRHRKREELVS